MKALKPSTELAAVVGPAPLPFIAWSTSLYRVAAYAMSYYRAG